MRYLKYENFAIRSIKRLDPPIQQRVEEEINKILKNPTQGKLLIGNLRGYCSWSFGDYRILYKISEEYVTIASFHLILVV